MIMEVHFRTENQNVSEVKIAHKNLPRDRAQILKPKEKRKKENHTQSNTISNLFFAPTQQ